MGELGIATPYSEIIKQLQSKAGLLEQAHRARMVEINEQFQMIVGMARGEQDVPDDWVFDQDKMAFVEPEPEKSEDSG